MIKYYQYIFSILFFTLLLIGNTACNKDEDQNIFCLVTLKVKLPDEKPIVRLEVEQDLASSFFRNLNNHLEYDFPIFTNNQASIMLQKGIYLLSFDGVVTFQDGTTKRVRSTEHATPKGAVNLLNDSEEVILNITYLSN